MLLDDGSAGCLISVMIRFRNTVNFLDYMKDHMLVRFYVVQSV